MARRGREKKLQQASPSGRERASVRQLKGKSCQHKEQNSLKGYVKNYMCEKSYPGRVDRINFLWTHGTACLHTERSRRLWGASLRCVLEDGERLLHSMQLGFRVLCLQAALLASGGGEVPVALAPAESCKRVPRSRRS